MNQLLILSCSHRKRTEPDLLPAIERYDGPAFRIVRRFLAQQPLQKPDIYILSAKFGLISANQMVPCYEQRMTLQRSRELQPLVIAEFRSITSTRTYQNLCICLGRDYIQAIDGYSKLLPSGLATQTITGSPGKQSALLYDWLYGKPPPLKGAEHTRPNQEKPRMRGVEITLTSQQVLEVARQALAGHYKEATNYQSWYVPVDEYRVAPKWLVSQLTGLPVKAFVTDEARRVLAELGVEVKRI